MDDRGFDALTRRLASGRTRRSVLRGLLGGGAALVAAKTGTTLAAKAPKVDVCHWDDDTGSYEWINVSENGWLNGHSAQHDLDFLRTDCCTASDCGADDTCTTYSCEQGTCTETSHPVDCQAGDWSEWDACSVACGGGTRTRTRSVVREAACSGAVCPALEESEACNTQSCDSCGGTCAAPGACLDGECFTQYPNCAGGYGVASNGGGVNACICGSGTYAVCETSGQCPDGQVCILIPEGTGYVGHCYTGCPA